MHLHFVSPYPQSSGLSSPFWNPMEYTLILPRIRDRKVRTRVRKPPPFLRDSEKLPSSTVKTSAGTGNERQLWQPQQERTGYFWRYKRSVKYKLSSPGGVVIWPSSPVLAEVLTVKLGNFPESRINGGGFQFRVRTFRSSCMGKNQGILHWISEGAT